MDEQEGRLAPAVDLYWIPLGAGGYVVRWSGKLYEALKALTEHRPRLDLYHSALQIWLPNDRFVIECAAILNLRGEERGVVAGGPVGMSWLGRFRHFRYEIRRWRGGSIPTGLLPGERRREGARERAAAAAGSAGGCRGARRRRLGPERAWQHGAASGLANRRTRPGSPCQALLNIMLIIGTKAAGVEVAAAVRPCARPTRDCRSWRARGCPSSQPTGTRIRGQPLHTRPVIRQGYHDRLGTQRHEILGRL
jgi:hypothetical protein